MAGNVCHNVHSNGETVEQVPVYKYLRIQLDHNLKFNCQLNLIYKVAFHKLFKLRIDNCGFGLFWNTPTKLLLSISVLKVQICNLYLYKHR